MVARNAARSFTGGYFSFRGYKIWYETSGELRGGVPIVMLHGGPGIPGNSYAPLMQRLAPARPSVRYDQLGCGRSDRPVDPSLWQVQTFLDELMALREALGLDQIHLLGHSWGGMLAIEYLLTRLCSPTGMSNRDWVNSTCRR